MNPYVVSPDWGWLIVAYFYLGGIAAGAYAVASMVGLWGDEDDRRAVRVADYLAFPLVGLCGLLLIVDLNRPERFWHMMIQSQTGRPMLKWWSPMSAGSWGLSLFGACTLASFVATTWPDRRPGRWLQVGPARLALQLVGCFAGFFVASYTGALLTATNQPMWSDTAWLAPLFLASAASTSLAALGLIAWRWNVGTPEARARLEGAEPLALALELVVLGAFVASLGDNLVPVLRTVRGNVLVFGTVVVAVLVPLLLHLRVGHRRPWAVPLAAACALVGGLLLRYGAVTTPGELLRRGPTGLVRFSPEEGRAIGDPGADVRNTRPESAPRTKPSLSPGGDDER
jgi:protein NrfD